MKTRVEIGDVGVMVRDPLPSGSTTAQELLRMAAAASRNGGDDPGDAALVRAAVEETGSIGFSQKEGSWIAPGRTRPYSTARIKPEGGGEELEVARGDLSFLMRMCGVSRETCMQMEKAMHAYAHQGYRAVALATRRNGGAWEFRGAIPMIANRLVKSIRDARTDFRYFPLWDWPLRVLHWMWVASVLTLAATGICIAEGWFLIRGELTSRFEFGDVRFIHYAVAWILVAVLILRFSLFFFASNKYQTFASLFPVSRQRWVDLYQTALDYFFARSFDGPRYIGHNPLQQWTYTGVYGLFTFMVVTGFALYALYQPTHWFYSWFMPLNDWIGVANVRLLHLIGMWCFLLFATIHVYLSILAGNVDRDGTISSMFSGGRWVRRGVRFHDQ